MQAALGSAGALKRKRTGEEWREKPALAGQFSHQATAASRAAPLLSPPAPAPCRSVLALTTLYQPNFTGPSMRASTRNAPAASRPSTRPASRAAPAPRAEPANNSAAPSFDPRLSSDEIEQWQAPGKSATPLLVSDVFFFCGRERASAACRRRAGR